MKGVIISVLLLCLGCCYGQEDNGCIKNFVDLETAVLSNPENQYQIVSAYLPPKREMNPVCVTTYYYLGINSSDEVKQSCPTDNITSTGCSKWKWCISSFYMGFELAILQDFSLHIILDETSEVELQLPPICNVTGDVLYEYFLRITKLLYVYARNISQLSKETEFIGYVAKYTNTSVLEKLTFVSKPGSLHALVGDNSNDSVDLYILYSTLLCLSLVALPIFITILMYIAYLECSDKSGPSNPIKTLTSTSQSASDSSDSMNIPVAGLSTPIDKLTMDKLKTSSNTSSSSGPIKTSITSNLIDLHTDVAAAGISNSINTAISDLSDPPNKPVAGSVNTFTTDSSNPTSKAIGSSLSMFISGSSIPMRKNVSASSSLDSTNMLAGLSNTATLNLQFMMYSFVLLCVFPAIPMTVYFQYSAVTRKQEWFYYYPYLWLLTCIGVNFFISVIVVYKIDNNKGHDRLTKLLPFWLEGILLWIVITTMQLLSWHLVFVFAGFILNPLRAFLHSLFITVAVICWILLLAILIKITVIIIFKCKGSKNYCSCCKGCTTWCSYILMGNTYSYMDIIVMISLLMLLICAFAYVVFIFEITISISNQLQTLDELTKSFIPNAFLIMIGWLLPKMFLDPKKMWQYIKKTEA